jgi:hypothetical protein
MSGERIDYAIERQRHEGIGRTALLAELDELLVADRSDCWVLGSSLPDEQLPVCRTRDGVNAHELFLPSVDVRGS